MAQLSMLQIALQLIEQGVEVEYTTRNDGGIRITKLEGTRYTGSTGNKIARQLVGATLSSARAEQLEKIRTPKGKFGHKRIEPLSADVKKQLRKAQRLYKKHGRAYGMITAKKYREYLKENTKEEANRRLNEAIRYAQGYAYTDVVKWWSQRLNDLALKTGSAILGKAAKQLLSKADIVTENMIEEIHTSYYDSIMRGQPTPDELGEKVLNMIGN